MNSRILILLLLALPGCKREPPMAPLVIDARAPAPAPDLLAPLPPPAPPLCEVEIMGQVQFPKGTPKKSQAAIVVADGDCLKPEAKVLGRSRSSENGPFFIEVFSRWGADLSVCAALEPAEGKATRIYGKLDKVLHAEGTGEVMFRDLRIEIKAQPGPPRTFGFVKPN